MTKRGRRACFGDSCPATPFFGRNHFGVRRLVAAFFFRTGGGIVREQRGAGSLIVAIIAQRRPFLVGGVLGGLIPVRVVSPSGVPNPRLDRVGPVNKHACPTFSPGEGGGADAAIRVAGQVAAIERFEPMQAIVISFNPF